MLIMVGMSVDDVIAYYGYTEYICAAVLWIGLSTSPSRGCPVDRPEIPSGSPSMREDSGID